MLGNEDTPAIFGEYLVEANLGPGSYGTTYLVRDDQGRPFALKWLRADAPAEGAERFLNEEWALKQADHPSIPKYITTGQERGRPYIVMTYAHGSNLQSQLSVNRNERGLFSQTRVLLILNSLLSALAHIHSIGLLHRDIKPANIIVSSSGLDVSLIDFGFCKGPSRPAEELTFWNAGSARFSPPDKLLNPSVSDPKHDVFAVGVLCYLLLTNEYPWTVEPIEDFGHLAKLMESTRPRPIGEINTIVDPRLAELVGSLITINPNYRLDAASALNRVEALRSQIDASKTNPLTTAGAIRFDRVTLDPLYGDIPLTNVERQILNTKEFQRLRHIKQLGFTNLVYVGAEHSRFSHAIGTMQIVERILRRIEKRNGAYFVAEERLAARMFALTHDISHAPYGHTLEDELNIFSRHDENDGRIGRILGESSEIARVLEDTEYGRAVMDFLDHRQPAPHYTWINELVTSPTGADVLDYINRDAFFCGLDHRVDSAIFRRYDVDRVADDPSSPRHLISLLYGRHGFRLDADYAVASVLRERYALFMKVYTHPTKIAAGAMLGKALFEAISGQKRGMLEQTVELMGDQELLLVLAASKKPICAKLAKSLLNRRLYKPVFRAPVMGQGERSLTQYDWRRARIREQGLTHPKSRHEMEARLAHIAGVNVSDIIVYATSSAPGAQKVRQYVRSGQDSGEVRDEASNHHEEMFRMHLALWNVYVFSNPDLPKEKKEKIADAFEEIIEMRNEIAVHRRQLPLLH